MTPVVPTIASRIRDRATQDPDGVALREKSLGIWQETTWAEYGDLVERAAHGLLTLGVRPGDPVAIECENRPEWLVVDAGAVAVRALTTSRDSAGARVLIAEDQEQVDNALDHQADLDWIVYIEPRGVRDYDEPSLVWWPDLLERGAAHRAMHPGRLDELAGEVRPDDAIALASGAVPPDAGPGDFVVCHLPLAEVESRASTSWLNAAAGVQLHFGEPTAGLAQTLHEVQPSLVAGDPDTWQTLRASVDPRIAVTRWSRRRLRDRLGLRKCRSAVSAGPTDPEVVAWFRGLGVPLEVA